MLKEHKLSRNQILIKNSNRIFDRYYLHSQNQTNVHANEQSWYTSIPFSDTTLRLSRSALLATRMMAWLQTFSFRMNCIFWTASLKDCSSSTEYTTRMASTFGRSSIDCRKIRARFELFRHGLTQVRIFFMKQTVFSQYISFYRLFHQKYIFVSICFVNRRNVLPLFFYVLKCRICSELSDISRATCSQIGQSRSFILCYDVWLSLPI